MKPNTPNARTVSSEPTVSNREVFSPSTGVNSVSPSLTKQDLEILKAIFPHERLGIKVQSFNREKTRAMLVLYLQHTDVQDRLEEVDPSWTTQVLTEEKINEAVSRLQG